MSSEPIQVTVVYTEGCANTPPTIQRVRDVAEEIGVPIDLSAVLVRTQEEAESYRFLGSPTVLVNGVDIDPALRDRLSFGFT